MPVANQLALNTKQSTNHSKGGTTTFLGYTFAGKLYINNHSRR